MRDRPLSSHQHGQGHVALGRGDFAIVIRAKTDRLHSAYLPALLQPDPVDGEAQVRASD